MIIRKLKVKNFKSFRELNLELNDFNILIGPNAGGKSNIVHIFEFLRDIARHGLENAISLQGGVEYFTNINLPDSEPFSVEVEFGELTGTLANIEEVNKALIFNTIMYNYLFSIRFNRNNSDYKIIDDRLVVTGFIKIVDMIKKEKKEYGKTTLIFSNKNGMLEYKFDIPDDFPYTREKFSEMLFKPFIGKQKIPNKNLIIKSKIIVFEVIKEIFKNIATYNLNPSLSKKPADLIGKLDLEPDGSNIALVLRKILTDDEKKRKFLNLINYILPFIDQFEVGKLSDRTLVIKIKETFSGDKYLPTSFMSEGTMNITALIVALYFNESPFVIIEEPGRNLHPSLISGLIQMMKEQSEKKQIMITTHNCEFLKHADIKDLILVSRDKEGFSQVSMPCESEEVKIFLENEMGIEELFTQNLLEI